MPKGRHYFEFSTLSENWTLSSDPPFPPPLSVNPYFDARMTHQHYLIVWYNFKMFLWEKSNRSFSDCSGLKNGVLKAMIGYGSSPKGCKLIHSAHFLEKRSLKDVCQQVMSCLPLISSVFGASSHLILILVQLHNLLGKTLFWFCHA